MKLILDNGVYYSLKIPMCLFNCNTKQFLIDTFIRWIENEVLEDEVSNEKNM